MITKDLAGLQDKVSDLIIDLEYIMYLIEDQAEPEEIMDELQTQSGTIATLISEYTGD